MLLKAAYVSVTSHDLRFYCNFVYFVADIVGPFNFVISLLIAYLLMGKYEFFVLLLGLF